MNRLIISLLLSLMFITSWQTARCDDWLQFRGSDGNGVSLSQNLPIKWDETANIAWKIPLPGRGASSPIVTGDRVFVTCSSGAKQDRLHIICFDISTGEELWHRQLWATGRTLCHPTSSVAAPSPASDGELVFAFFSSNDLACFDLDGNLQWFRGLAYDYPKAGNDIGMSSSPLVVGDTVIVQVENQGDSFAAGIDKHSGKTLWRTERAKRSCWTSPSVMRGATPEEDAVILQSSDRLTVHDPRTGKELWAYEQGCSSIPSAVAEQGVVYIPSQGITAVRGNGSDAEILWRMANLAPGNSSPIVYLGRIYSLNSAGVINCADTTTGIRLWSLRLRGSHWATPVVVDGIIYCVNQDGLVHVVQTGAKGKILQRNDLGEPIFGTPAIANAAIFIRSDNHLWKIAKTE